MTLSVVVLTVLGLSLFEIVSSIDNAVINAEVLGTMSRRGGRWFLSWGFFFAVVFVRGVLPWLIVWGANPKFGPWGALTAAFSNDPRIAGAVAQSAPVLLASGGVFLLFLFFQWLFLEPKVFGLKGEHFFYRNGVWFYAVVAVLLAALVWAAIGTNVMMAFGMTVGSAVFFVIHGFKENAVQMEEKLLKKGRIFGSDISKILYLEIIDATFSVDGVLGAFAFTLSVPLIIIGNGLGAFILRKLTVCNIETVKKYKFLKNGAMYAIFMLGVIMLADAFGKHVPEWVSPVATFFIIGYFFIISLRALQKEEKKEILA